MKSPDEIAQDGKNTIDALTKSGTAFADGFGEISFHVLALTREAIANNLQTGKKMFDIKTPSDWFELQSKWVGDLMTIAVAQMGQLSKMSAKTINQTCEPLKTHFGASFDKVSNLI